MPLNDVQYNNKDNTDNKDNKDNEYSVSSYGREDFASRTASPEGLGESLGVRLGSQTDCKSSVAPGPEILPVDEQQLKGCILGLFDNGEQTTQRYKVKVRLNLVDGSNPEFIANLTKDLGNFKKYIPESHRQQTIAHAHEIRAHVKSEVGHFPYIGKLHFNQGREKNMTRNQIEPDTFIAVWWNPRTSRWSGILQFQQWIHKFDFTDEYLTASQVKSNVKCQSVWRNPQHEKPRPMTWAQRRQVSK